MPNEEKSTDSCLTKLCSVEGEDCSKKNDCNNYLDCYVKKKNIRKKNIII